MTPDPYLPPGCTVSMIPGNRPEDEEWERWATDEHLAEIIRDYIDSLSNDDLLLHFYERNIKCIDRMIEDRFQAHLETDPREYEI
jgi:hypothetical protein